MGNFERPAEYYWTYMSNMQIADSSDPKKRILGKMLKISYITALLQDIFAVFQAP